MTLTNIKLFSKYSKNYFDKHSVSGGNQFNETDQ